MFQTKNKESLLRTLLWSGVIILIITLFVSTYLRTSNLSNFLNANIMPLQGSIDYGYAKNPLLTLIHILPGAVFIVLGALQFVKPIRDQYKKFHRLSGKIYLLLGIIIGTSSLAMAFMIQFGGWIETAAILIFSPYFLYSLLKAYKYIREQNFALHREWMIRAYSIGLAVATMRPIIGLLFAFTNIPFNEFFGTVFWIAFITHTIIAELWIRYTRN